MGRRASLMVEHDPDSGLATAIIWTRKTSIDDTLPGVYCLRSNCLDRDAATLWSTYIMLTDLEVVFRSPKCELGLHSVFRHNQHRDLPRPPRIRGVRH